VSGGYVQFTVTSGGGGQGPSITFGGVQYNLNNTDVVRLTINSDTRGYAQGATIVASTNQITTFAFNDVDLIINGVDYGRKTINSINIGGYGTFTSTLTLNVPSLSSQTKLEAPLGSCVICNIIDSYQITVYNLGMGSGGINFAPTTTSVYYTGGATGYSLT
jgi:hypothetical protein